MKAYRTQVYFHNERVIIEEIEVVKFTKEFVVFDMGRGRSARISNWYCYFETLEDAQEHIEKSLDRVIKSETGSMNNLKKSISKHEESLRSFRIDRIKTIWNTLADGMNQWNDLGGDEKEELLVIYENKDELKAMIKKMVSK